MFDFIGDEDGSRKFDLRLRLHYNERSIIDTAKRGFENGTEGDNVLGGERIDSF